MSRMDAHCPELPRPSSAITARVLVMYKQIVQLCVSAELAPVDVATTVVNQDTWLYV